MIITDEFIQSYIKPSDLSYRVVTYIEHPEYLQQFYKDFLFLPHKIVIYEVSKLMRTFNASEILYLPH